MDKKQEVISPYFFLVLAPLLWSGNHIVGRALTDQVPTFGLSFVRWFVPALILLPFVRRHLACDWRAIQQNWRVILFLGITGGAIFGALQYIGLRYTTALNVSVLNSTAPIFIAAAAGFMFGDRFSLAQIAGITCSLIGVLVVVTKSDFLALRALSFNPGDLIIIVNMAVWAAYSASLRLRPDIHWVSFIFMLAIISSLCTFPLFMWELLSGQSIHLTVTSITGTLYVSIFPSLLALMAWNKGVETIGANQAGAYLHLVPLYSAGLATVFLGEVLSQYHIVGFTLIISGVALTSWKPSCQK